MFGFVSLGGTADIIVEQLEENGTLTEIVSVCSEELGGISVDNAFRQFMDAIFGKDALDIMKKDSE